MSIISLFTAGLACLVPLTSAYTKPVGAAPKGNPISEPGLNDVVPVGEPFTITWQPTTPGTVTLVLLKGPSTNAVPQYAIVENIPNSGTYAWVPSEQLAPGQTGYGIQLIDDATGQYQYTTQFGISNPGYGKQPEDDEDDDDKTPTAKQPQGYPRPTTSKVASSPMKHPHGYPRPTSSQATSSSSAKHPQPTGASTGGMPGTIVYPTGWSHNTTSAKPTGGYAMPTTGRPSASTSAPISSYAPSSPTDVPNATPTGGASTLATSFLSLAFAAAVAVFAL